MHIYLNKRKIKKSKFEKKNVNNKKYDLEAGSAVDVTVNERACKVVLTKCSRESYSPSSFELVCS